ALCQPPSPFDADLGPPPSQPSGPCRDAGQKPQRVELFPQMGPALSGLHRFRRPQGGRLTAWSISRSDWIGTKALAPCFVAFPTGKPLCTFPGNALFREHRGDAFLVFFSHPE